MLFSGALFFLKGWCEILVWLVRNPKDKNTLRKP